MSDDKRPADWNWNYPGKDEDIKIFRYIDSPDGGYDRAPISTDYKTGLTRRLYDDPTFVDGILTRMRWFADEAKTDLVLTVQCEYDFDRLGQELGRTTTRIWYREDGLPAEPIKITKKRYSTIQAHSASIRRRHNIITQVKIAAVYLLAQTTTPESGHEEAHLAEMAHIGSVFLSKVRLDVENYVEDANHHLVQVLATATEEWLDNQINADGVTIRQYMISHIR